MSVPQLVPSQAALPVSWHVAVPVWQLIFPMRHNVVGVQLPPAVQLLQFPSLHTLFAPHDVPLVTLPDSVHTALPVEHDVVPVLHGFDGWQPAFAVHGPQLPLLQTMFVPQVAPFERFVPVSVQAIVGAQAILPA